VSSTHGTSPNFPVIIGGGRVLSQMEVPLFEPRPWQHEWASSLQAMPRKMAFRRAALASLTSSGLVLEEALVAPPEAGRMALHRRY